MTGVKNKKVLILIAAAVVAAAAAVAVIFLVNSDTGLFTVSQAGIDDASQVTLISHRGMVELAPENTLEAAEKSAENGFSYVEFDIRRTLDGVWVLMHDADIERTTTGEGEVSSLTYKQLLAHTVDEGNCVEEYERITVPTLEQMLELCAEKNLTPVIEIKQNSTEYMSELLNLIATKRSGSFMMISFDREQMQTVYDLLNSGKTVLDKNTIELFWLTSDLEQATLETAMTNKEIGVSFNGNKKITEEQIDAFKNQGIELATWTINKPKVMQKLYSFGIRTFTTDAATYNSLQEG